MWYFKTLQELHAIRQGLGNVKMRQALWGKHYWTGADDKLTFDHVDELCRRLNIHSSHEDLFVISSRFFLIYLSVVSSLMVLHSCPSFISKMTSRIMFLFFCEPDLWRCARSTSSLDSNDLSTLHEIFY